MKKIGLLTFHASHNNGSMLQAYALQHVIETRYKHCVEMIDFSNRAQQIMYSPIPKPDNFRRIIKAFIWLTNYRQLKKSYRQYDEFKNKYFNLSKNKYSTSEELGKEKFDYDLFISGSDQVWNIKCRDADDAYYLNFVPEKAKKYAYATSFGANNPFEIDGNSNIHKDLISDFSMVSVREKNAQKWIMEALNVEVPMCLDPTMLLDSEEWDDLLDIDTMKGINKPYIFYYCFSITKDVKRFLRRTSKKYKMPVYFMDAKEWTLKCCWLNKIKLTKFYGPIAYLNLVKNARIFITTSFHGTAFATIYKKNFWYIDSGHDISKDDRAVSFLTQLGLMSRYIKLEKLEGLDLLQSPSYQDSYKKLEELRKNSFNYLDSFLKE